MNPENERDLNPSRGSIDSIIQSKHETIQRLKTRAVRRHPLTPSEVPGTEDEETALRFLLTSLSPHSAQIENQDQNKDLNIVKNVFLSLIEARDEGVLNEAEADSLMEYVVSRFVQNRIQSLLSDVLDFGFSSKYTYQRIRGY